MAKQQHNNIQMMIHTHSKQYHALHSLSETGGMGTPYGSIVILITAIEGETDGFMVMIMVGLAVVGLNVVLLQQ